MTRKRADEMSDVEKRFGQVASKIVSYEALGGDASAFKTQLASLRADFVTLRATMSATPGAVTRDTAKAFEKRVKRLKSLVESSIFALGGTEDDDFADELDEDADDLFEDLDDVATIEDDDDNGVSREVRTVAREHKAAVSSVKNALSDVKKRNGIAQAFFGADYDALERLNAEASQMNTRAAALEAAASQIADPEIKGILVAQASTLRSEASKLQAYAGAEGNQFSLFGWFFNLF